MGLTNGTSVRAAPATGTSTAENPFDDHAAAGDPDAQDEGEGDQGEDLNGDGDSDDLVLQTFNVRLAGQGTFAPVVAGSSRRVRSARTRSR